MSQVFKRTEIVRTLSQGMNSTCIEKARNFQYIQLRHLQIQKKGTLKKLVKKGVEYQDRNQKSYSNLKIIAGAAFATFIATTLIFAEEIGTKVFMKIPWLKPFYEEYYANNDKSRQNSVAIEQSIQSFKSGVPSEKAQGDKETLPVEEQKI